MEPPTSLALAYPYLARKFNSCSIDSKSPFIYAFRSPASYLAVDHLLSSISKFPVGRYSFGEGRRGPLLQLCRSDRHNRDSALRVPVTFAMPGDSGVAERVWDPESPGNRQWSASPAPTTGSNARQTAPSGKEVESRRLQGRVSLKTILLGMDARL